MSQFFAYLYKIKTSSTPELCGRIAKLTGCTLSGTMYRGEKITWTGGQGYILKIDGTTVWVIGYNTTITGTLTGAVSTKTITGYTVVEAGSDEMLGPTVEVINENGAGTNAAVYVGWSDSNSCNIPLARGGGMSIKTQKQELQTDLYVKGTAGDEVAVVLWQSVPDGFRGITSATQADLAAMASTLTSILSLAAENGGKTLKFAVVNLSSDGELIAAVANKVLKVCFAHIMAAAAVVFTLKSDGGTGTALTGPLNYPANGGLVLPLVRPPLHYLATAVGKNLYMDFTTAGQVSGWLIYWDSDAS